MSWATPTTAKLLETLEMKVMVRARAGYQAAPLTHRVIARLEASIAS